MLIIPNNEYFLRIPTFPLHKNHILKIQDIKDLMRREMNQLKGAGIAANQIGSNWSIFLISRKVIKKPLDMFIINPQIIWKSNKQKLMNEGCLSVPERREKIMRAESVTLTGWNEFGRDIKIEKATGLLAQVLQHETDHLDGIVFLERLSLMKRKFIKKQFLKDRNKQTF